MNTFTLYILCFAVPLIVGLAVQGWLRSTFARNSRVPVGSGMTGADVARRILDSNGLQNVPVQPSKAGPLSDHYDPRTRGVFLSEAVFAGRSVAATAVAAHEVGHAIQHAKSYLPMTVRSAIWPSRGVGLAGVVLHPVRGPDLRRLRARPAGADRVLPGHPLPVGDAAGGVQRVAEGDGSDQGARGGRRTPRLWAPVRRSPPPP